VISANIFFVLLFSFAQPDSSRLSMIYVRVTTRGGRPPKYALQ
jgi:hypothetical protein